MLPFKYVKSVKCLVSVLYGLTVHSIWYWISDIEHDSSCHSSPSRIYYFCIDFFIIPQV